MLRADKLVVNRITEAEVEHSVMYPVLQSTKQWITNLIVEDGHRIKHHLGENQLSSKVVVTEVWTANKICYSKLHAF